MGVGVELHTTKAEPDVAADVETGSSHDMNTLKHQRSYAPMGMRIVFKVRRERSSRGHSEFPFPCVLRVLSA